MNNDILELTELSQDIYFKKIWETTSTYQVGYELTIPIEKLNTLKSFKFMTKVGKIHLLRYSHISINGEIHPLEAIEGCCASGRQRKTITLLFKCEYKEVTHNEKDYD